MSAPAAEAQHRTDEQRDVTGLGDKCRLASRSVGWSNMFCFKRLGPRAILRDRLRERSDNRFVAGGGGVAHCHGVLGHIIAVTPPPPAANPLSIL